MNPRLNGHPKRSLSAVVVRDLTEADIALLQTTEGRSEPQRIRKIHDSHHWLARRLASGMSQIEAGMVTGFSPTQISILKSDPAFRELLKFYRTSTDEIWADVQQRMSTLSLEALGELRDRLHEKPEALSPLTLLEIVKALADRTGYGPSSKSTVTTVNIDLAGRLERARARTARAIEPIQVISSQEGERK